MFILPIASGGGFPVWTVAPFATLLLGIAVLPLLAPHWWHSNRNKAVVAVGIGLPALALVLVYGAPALGHAALEYAAFIALLGSLYTISGGIRVTGSLAGTPLANTVLLAVGGLLASVIGTTGAAMLLIRPFLRANRSRTSKVHLVVFFILIVANCGGLLTPLGDPPLFLGFLRGVPFVWTLGLWKIWLTVVSALLVLFNLIDQHRFHREDLATTSDLDEEAERHDPLGLQGGSNFLLLAGVIGTVLLSGFVLHPRYGEGIALAAQAVLMGALGVASYVLTPRAVRRRNEFSWHPLVEVAVLFAGIFVAMIPALDVLKTRGEQLGVREPWQFFWAAGLLSAFLDNAPTYMAFLELGQYLPDDVAGTSTPVLAAISCGAVFFGAMTYIGNGPNFMVKAIAEESGVKMPSFFGYLAWSAGLLLPVLVVCTLLFFRS
jgi:Na+/H+ antiporter NhaD/arsenite permease-like protein